VAEILSNHPEHQSNAPALHKAHRPHPLTTSKRTTISHSNLLNSHRGPQPTDPIFKASPPQWPRFFRLKKHARPPPTHRPNIKPPEPKIGRKDCQFLFFSQPKHTPSHPITNGKQFKRPSPPGNPNSRRQFNPSNLLPVRKTATPKPLNLRQPNKKGGAYAPPFLKWFQITYPNAPTTSSPYRKASLLRRYRTPLESSSSLGQCLPRRQQWLQRDPSDVPEAQWHQQ